MKGKGKERKEIKERKGHERKGERMESKEGLKDKGRKENK